MSSSGTTPTACPHCGRKYNLPGDAIGRKARCKACHETFTVEAAGASVPPVPSVAGAKGIKVRCDCGKSLRVPSSAAGRAARCPNCQATVTVPVGGGGSAGGPGGGDADDALAMEDPFGHGAEADAFADDDLLGGLSGGEALEQPRVEQVSMTCGKCGATTPAGPVCSVCGADPVSYGVEGAAAAGAGAGVGGAASRMSRDGMRLGIGVASALAAGAVGAAIWFAVALFMNSELALLAWGIGGLVGFAMAVGSQQSGMLHGTIAATISVVSILVGKAVAFFVVLMPLFAVMGAMTDIGSPREALALEWTQNYFDPDREDVDAAYADANARAQADVDALSDEEFWEAFREKAATDYAWQDALDAVDEDGYSDEDEYWGAVEAKSDELTTRYERDLAEATPEELEQRWMDWKDSSFVTQGVSMADFSRGFFSTMFGLWDILFIGLALLTAFRIGAEGLGG